MIDGSKVEAVASRKTVITSKKLVKQTEALDGKIAQYLADMDAADGEEASAEAGPADVAGARWPSFASSAPSCRPRPKPWPRRD